MAQPHTKILSLSGFFLLFCSISLAIDIPLTSSESLASSNQAVTYRFSGGRFGDNLLAYMHAKWISYRYKIPLLYIPFEYSDKLFLDMLEIRYHENIAQKYKEQRTIYTSTDLEQALHASTLLFLPYFPESEWERTNTQYYGRPWGYIPVNWEDQGFRALMKQMIRPKIPTKKLKIPKGYISIACHLRRGGSFDPASLALRCVLKFPPDSFFISELKWLQTLFPGKKLYVYLFTDDQNPVQIKEKFEREFRTSPILFSCRTEQNDHNLHVLEDFFALTQFDCLIFGESNYTVCASKLNDYLVTSQATHFRWDGNMPIIDQVSRHVRKDKIKARVRGE